MAKLREVQHIVPVLWSKLECLIISMGSAVQNIVPRVSNIVPVSKCAGVCLIKCGYQPYYSTNFPTQKLSRSDPHVSQI